MGYSIFFVLRYFRGGGVKKNTLYQVSQLNNTLGSIVSHSAIAKQRRLQEQNGGKQESSALKLTGCKLQCFSPKEGMLTETAD